MVGTLARVAPEIEHLRRLIADGFVGEVLSTTLVARGGGRDGFIPERKNSAYLLDRANGATMLTIPVGHTLAALRDVLGEVAEVSSMLTTRRTTTLVGDTGETLPMSAPDQVLVSGVLASGAPVSIHYRGGTARDSDGFFWEINGTEGDIRVSGPLGHTQMVKLSLNGAHSDEKVFRPLELPASYRSGWPGDVVAGNVARIYARMAQDLREGTRTPPSFADAVAVHRGRSRKQRKAGAALCQPLPSREKIWARADDLFSTCLRRGLQTSTMMEIGIDSFAATCPSCCSRPGPIAMEPKTVIDHR